MVIAHSTVTEQGQISVPAEVRLKLGLGPGSVLEWGQDEEKVFLRRVGLYTSEDVHRALFANPPKARKLAEMKEGVKGYMRRRHARR